MRTVPVEQVKVGDTVSVHGPHGTKVLVQHITSLTINRQPAIQLRVRECGAAGLRLGVTEIYLGPGHTCWVE